MKLPFLKSFLSYFPTLKPLAWAQLSHQKVRLAVAITGVAFSNILSFTQLGVLAMLFDGVTLVPQSLNGDLFLVSVYAQTIDFGAFLPRIFLYQAEAIEGVASASPLYISESDWVNPEVISKQGAIQPNTDSEKKQEEVSNTVKILAFNLAQPVFNLPEVNRQSARLTIPGGVLFDRLGQPQLGPVPELYLQQGVVNTVMNRRRVSVVGLFSLGSTLFDNGRLIMSDWNYARLEGQDSLKKISVGILTLEPGANLKLVQKRLQNSLPQEVRVLTREELSQREQNYRTEFPEAKMLKFGATISFIVGVVIVYQVLYTDISDHLPEYATLKAIGYSDVSLLIVVLQEAIILAVMGFIPGFLISHWVYGHLTKITRIPLVMSPVIACQVFVLTLLMCAISGAIAMNKLRSADPVDVF